MAADQAEEFDREVEQDLPAALVRWVRASAGVGASLPDGAVQRFCDELDRVVADRFPGDVLGVPHRVWAVVARYSG
ncbi:hypothetical protein [Streptomyces albireticuli]|uniref:Uncharacterized protein n=1 Tax=Streptomyces albireticuli TaxID=1940 RepID=A0A2A2D8A6_9ACTN|nr:hypothetical protein [Streptomyces albireticuli]MCD9145452.1 hypothetical protein [Streptomyces albireticuli]MCD9164983.1 hypothetical protein [Streptomyces albireticuli]MCD9195426.1 hypothetical protein [Streptomyces albireticuli]PAU48713.1 hypothetical protein CK936_11720 [Streptomyces albireticuli]